MLNSLYIKALSKRGQITDVSPEEDLKSHISDFWYDKVISKSSKDFSIGAGDGSFNKKKFLNSNVYAVAAESLIYDGELKRIDFSDFEIAPSISYIDELLSYYMSIFEFKCCLRSIKDYNVDYYQFDGSIFGDLINPFPRGAPEPADIKNNINESILDDFQKSIHDMDEKGLSFFKIKDRYFKSIKGNDYDYYLYLASIERLLVLYEILQYPKRLVAVSKTSSDRTIFNSAMPDIAVFDKYTKKQGISKGCVTKSVEESMPFSYPVYDDFFKKLKFTVFYVRLRDFKNVLKVELPYRAKKSEILDIVEKINKMATGGYPYLLNKAHNDVVITNRNMDELIKIARIIEKTNREML